VLILIHLAVEHNFSFAQKRGIIAVGYFIQMRINLVLLLLLPAALCSIASQHTLTDEGHVLMAESHMGSTSGSGWAGFIIGPILFFCSFICIWYN
jgi:predicted Kef-type K+ transport protein